MKKVFIPDPIRDISSFSGIPNVWFDEVQKELSPVEWSVLCVLLRKSYGFCQEVVEASNKYIRIKTHLSKHTVVKAINSLIEKKYVYCVDKGVGTGRGKGNPAKYCLVTGYQREFDDNYIDDMIDDLVGVSET